MQLRVLSRYQARDEIYEPGQILDLPEAEAERLLADSPGSFTTEAPEENALNAAVDAPPRDKMVKRSKTK